MISKIDKGIYTVGNRGSVLFSTGKKNKKTILHTDIKLSNSNGRDVANWGSDNLYPQRFIKKLNKTGAAIGGLEVLKSAHYGTGFKLFQEEEFNNRVIEKQRATSSFPEIQEFFNLVRWDIFMSDIVDDFETFHLAFVEYLLSPNFDKIISIKRQPTGNCRFGLPSKKNGLIEKVFINSDWEKYNEDFTETVDYIPPFINTFEVKEYCKQKGIHKFIIPIIDTLSLEKIYPFVRWHAPFHNGWVDVVLSVPELKKFIFENQLHVKYVVYVADDFFIHKYGKPTWDDFDNETQEEKRKDLVDKIDKHMSGNQAGARSFTSPYFRDANNNMIKGIEVIPIPDFLKDGNYLPDASAGNSEVLFAMGVDPALVGAGIPGGKNLSGSGSDKREAYTILTTRMPIKRIRTIEPFNVIRDWNGWDPTLYGKFPNINLTTLDKNPNGQKQITH